MLRAVIALILTFALSINLASAQDAATTSSDARASTGGAQTLEDILARQNGEKIDDSFRSSATGNPDSAAAISAQLGTLGGTSDAEVWRTLRYGSADVKVSAGGEKATVLIQDGGMWWLSFRQGPLATYGAYLIAGMIALLVIFYGLRGRIMIDGKKTGKTIERFKLIERVGHWLLAGSFILLGLTGLISLFGRMYLIPVFGKESFATIALASKWVHNNVSWAFIAGLIMVFVMWVAHNVPNRTDLTWLAQGGGIFTKGVHPPARKFNAGQKLIFWAVIILGASISITGLSLLFPFELPMFAATFKELNAVGLPQLVGLGELPAQLAPHEEMQFAQLWHSVVAMVLIAIIIAHIYIGSIGMEGAFDAMGSGQVEEQWAKEHHALWVEEMKSNKSDGDAKATPAE